MRERRGGRSVRSGQPAVSVNLPPVLRGRSHVRRAHPVALLLRLHHGPHRPHRLPEYSLQGALCASFLLTLHWLPLLVMAPVTYYHAKLYMDQKHLVDVTEIFRQLNWEKKYRMIKLAFYFSLFILTIYRLVMTAVLLFIDEDANLLDTRTI